MEYVYKLHKKYATILYHSRFILRLKNRILIFAIIHGGRTHIRRIKEYHNQIGSDHYFTVTIINEDFSLR